MLIEGALLQAIAERVVGYVWDKVEDRIRRSLGRDSTTQAFKHALQKAFVQFEEQHSQWTADLFDVSFFEREGAPILAQFLLRDGHPDPNDLAILWASSLNLQSEQGALHIHELKPIAADFLDYLAQSLKEEPELKELNDSRAFEQLANDLKAIRRKFGAEQSTFQTRQDYLHWLIERNLYLDPRGTLQTQRQVQVKLDQVYISLRAQYEKTPGEVDRRLLEQELTVLDSKISITSLPAEEIEDQREQLLARLESRTGTANVRSSESIELAEVVKLHDRLVILGDPGSGKSTLTRFLTLKHSQALYKGQTEADANLGPARFPILIRIADYAEHGMPMGKSLSDFLVDYCSMHECPETGLADMLAAELASGSCLILLDGLDEIVSADERRSVVQRIEDFIRRYGNRPNRFVITSRIAGYRSAPLGEPFTHYSVQEMDEAQIRRFLERWCPAVEEAQTADLSTEARETVAQREIEGIMKAVLNSPGVRRLAANPLLLRILALIHRTGAQLPQRRIELYRLAADTLARTWRTAQGVPETALVKDEYLTPLLSKLAYWLHDNKPTGIATEREVYEVLGEEWARLNYLPWNADDPSPKIKEEVNKFLIAVREHTGLFVERAPKRYGFMHLTFEEYYAARYLIARSKTRAMLIRNHLHNPRWNEPILLALGFVGLESPVEASELLEIAILAEGEDATTLGFTSSAFESLLGRDYLFALRCLGDNIPTNPRIKRPLIKRLANELLYQTHPAQFRQYRQTLLERLDYLKATEEAYTLSLYFVEALNDTNGSPDMYYHALENLGRLDQAPEAVVAALVNRLQDDNFKMRRLSAESLGQLGQTSGEVVTALLNALRSAETKIRISVAQSLSSLRQASSKVIAALLKGLRDDDPQVRMWAAQSFGQLEEIPEEVVNALIDSLRDTDPDVRMRAAQSLGRLEQVSGEVIAALLKALHDNDARVRRWAVQSLRQLDQNSDEVVAALLDAFHDSDPDVRIQVAQSLGQLKQAPNKVVSALLQGLHDSDSQVRYWVAKSLQIEHSSNEVVTALLTDLHDADPDIRVQAAQSLGRLEQVSGEVIAALLKALHDNDARVRRWAVQSLRRLRNTSDEVVAALLIALSDTDSEVRIQAVQSLGQLKQAPVEVVTALLKSLHDADARVRSWTVNSLEQQGLAPSNVVTALLNTLSDVDPYVRIQVTQSLTKLRQMSNEVINALLKGLEDDNSRVRSWTVDSLEELGQRFSEVVTTLLDSLNSENPGVYIQSAEILERLGLAPDKVVKTLLNTLPNNDPQIRESVVVTLGELRQMPDEVVVELSKCLRDDSLRVRALAALQLEQMGHVPSEIMDVLLSGLRSNDPEVRLWAANGLEQLGQASDEVITVFLNGLCDEDPEIRILSIQSLGGQGQTSEKVLLALLNSLHDIDPDVRLQATIKLGQLGQVSGELVSALLNAIGDEDYRVRRWVMQDFELLGSASNNVVTALLSALNDVDPQVRIQAAQSLRQLIPESHEAIDSLLYYSMRDDNPEIRIRSAQLLQQIGETSSEIVSALLYALNDIDPDVRIQAANSLGRLGQSSSEVIPVLLNSLKDDDPRVCIQVAQSLYRLRQTSSEIISTLHNGLRDDNPIIRLETAQSLEQLAQVPSQLTPELLNSLYDADSRIRIQVAQSLGKMTEMSDEVRDALINSLSDGNFEVRIQAAMSLGRIKQTSSEVVAALLNSLYDINYEVRVQAAQSLAQLGQETDQMSITLIQLLMDARNWSVRSDSARLLGKISRGDETIIHALLRGLLDIDNDVRTTCVEALALLGQRFPIKAKAIAMKLVEAIEDPEFDKIDLPYEKRTAHDYAYDALWMLAASGVLERIT